MDSAIRSTDRQKPTHNSPIH